MTISARLVVVVGLVATGLLALGDQFDVVPSALVTSVASWWILRDARVVRQEGDEDA